MLQLMTMGWWWPLLLTRTLSWMFILLANWNNNLRIYFAPLGQSIPNPNQSVFTFTPLCMLRAWRRSANTNCIGLIFGFTRQGLEPTMYHTRGENLNHYTTDAIFNAISRVPIKVSLKQCIFNKFIFNFLIITFKYKCYSLWNRPSWTL